MGADERESAAFSKRLALQSVGAITVVSLASLVHSRMGLLACSDDSGGSVRCWMYDSAHGGGWVKEALYVLFAPIALVVVGSGLALWYWWPRVLWVSTAAAIAFTLIVGVAGYGIFGPP